ncbi:MAG: hypothetical protein Q4B54_03795 [Coriobacteriales bacterium]|nr:hypothetical protein [Coriobacteriales bacterium]
MSNGIDAFLETLQTDVTLQEKIKTATDAYTGEYTMEAMFQNIVAPVAVAAGYDVGWEDVVRYAPGNDESQDLEPDELELVAGSCDGRMDIGYDSADEDEDDGYLGGAVCVG